MSEPSPAWDAWFEFQFKVCRDVDRLLDRELTGQPQTMRAAVAAALLEHLAERIRMHLDLSVASQPAPVKVRERGEDQP